MGSQGLVPPQGLRLSEGGCLARGPVPSLGLSLGHAITGDQSQLLMRQAGKSVATMRAPTSHPARSCLPLSLADCALGSTAREISYAQNSASESSCRGAHFERIHTRSGPQKPIDNAVLDTDHPPASWPRGPVTGTSPWPSVLVQWLNL